MALNKQPESNGAEQAADRFRLRGMLKKALNKQPKSNGAEQAAARFRLRGKLKMALNISSQSATALNKQPIDLGFAGSSKWR